MHHVLGDVGCEEVARHVEQVLRRVTAALSGPTVINLDQRRDTYMGDKTAGYQY